MHPKELSNMALVAACAARQDGFKATADAFLALAAACKDGVHEPSQLDEAIRPGSLARRLPSDQDLVLNLH